MDDAGDKQLPRCDWAVGVDPLYVRYHDEEWGVPVYDDGLLFEFLVLEGFQAGLSWATILRKREHLRMAFGRFVPEVVANYSEEKVRELLADPGIVRNRAKIEGAIRNAQAFLKVRQEWGSFASFVWSFVDHRPVVNFWREMHQVPASSPQAAALSKALRARGFTFVGPTICYAFMQAVGMVNDHLVSCFRHRELALLVGETHERARRKSCAEPR
ncbi:MAG: DNA-3-methyladenine glycosylase I [bacterium]|nr:DNA-3-methyladenine glycosylase I [candidate division KSB1 bacterium]MDH7560820.1 DNA-3-methyladenine glycosylase I [bacterium]